MCGSQYYIVEILISEFNIFIYITDLFVRNLNLLHLLNSFYVDLIVVRHLVFIYIFFIFMGPCIVSQI